MSRQERRGRDETAGAGGSSQQNTADRDELAQVVLDTTRTKTGYPPELLEFDLELEADLGIDSVKQAEILGAIRDHYELPTDVEFDLTELNTLSNVINFVSDAVGKQDGGHRPTPPDPRPVADRISERIARRYVPVATEQPLVHGAQPAFDLRDKGVVVVSDREGTLCDQLAPHLTDAGARMRVVDDVADPERLAAGLAAAHQELGTVQVVVNLYPFASGTGTSAMDARVDDWTAEVDTRSSVDLLAVKEFYADLTTAGGTGGYFAATTIGDSFGVETTGDLDPLGSLTAGFVKSLALELPNLKAKVVDFSGPDPQAGAQRLFDEIVTASEPNVEVGYVDGARKILLVMPHELDSNNHQEPLRLGPDAVVVVSGGSRGITYECVKELLTTRGVTVVLLGRSPMPTGDEEWLHLDDDEFAAQRIEFLQQAKREDPSLTPVGAEAKFSRMANQRALHRNVAELRNISSRVYYEVCDVADGAQVDKVVDSIRQRHGNVSGVIHGAGLQSICAANKKRYEHSLNLIRTKVNGAYHLWHAVKADDPSFFVLVGSILGRCGMDGQVDYTAASDVMPKISAQLARTYPATRSFTIAWTAWADTGMAAGEDVRRIQEEQRGLRFLGIEEGVETLLHELFNGGDDPETLVFGDTGTNDWRGLDAALDGDRTRITAPVGAHGHIADRLNHPMLDEAHHEEESVRATKRLRTDVDLYLRDHAMRGAGTLPGTMHLETHAETASLLCPNLLLAEAEEIEFLRFVKDNAKFPLTLSPHAWLGEANHDHRKVHAEIRSDLVGRGDRVLEADRLHSRGTYSFAGRLPEAPQANAAVSRAMRDGEAIDLELLYSKAAKYLSYGPTFRHVRSAWRIDESETVSEIAVPRPRNLLSFATSPRLRTMPIVIDNAWRSPLMSQYQRSGEFCVPVSIGHIRFYRSPLPTESVYTHSKITRTREPEEGRMTVDTHILDATGRLLCDIEDLTVIRVGNDTADAGPTT